MVNIEGSFTDSNYVECTQFARIKVALQPDGDWTEAKVRLVKGGQTAEGKQIFTIEVEQ